MNHKIAMGTSDFKKIIEQKNFYVDKTQLIVDVVDDDSEVLLIPRPRRFGKSLNLSMLRYFYEKSEADHRTLFDGLAVSKNKETMMHQGRYPVIYLDFKDVKPETFQSFESRLKTLFSRLYEVHESVLKPTLAGRERAYYQNILNEEAVGGHLTDGLFILSKYLFEHYGERVIILIDEYDAPLHESYINGFYDKASRRVRDLLSPALKGSPYLKKGVLTGILRIAKESIFSGLNNINVCSILSVEFSQYFGFTQNELERALANFDVSPCLEMVRTWYNGYRFGDETIYNPWSILKFLKDPEHEAMPYWLGTGENILIRDQILNIDFHRDLKTLLKGGTVRVKLNEDVSLRDLAEGAQEIWSILTFSGYLKIVAKHRENTLSEMSFDVAIPNLELMLFYQKTIARWVGDRLGKTGDLLSALYQADFERFERELHRAIQQCASYFDLSKEPEMFYHAFMLGALVQEGSPYQVRSNRESGYGRYDIQLAPRETNLPGFILEFKRVFKGAELERALDEAIQQIHHGRYETELKAQGVKQIYGVAIAFMGKRLQLRVTSLGEEVVKIFSTKLEAELTAKLLILTASQREYDAVFAQKDLFESATPLEDRRGFVHQRLAFQSGKGCSRSAILACLPQVGEVAEQVKPWIDDFKPQMLALVGTCSGNPDHTALGDLCLASGVVLSETDRTQETLALPLRAQWDARARQLGDTWAEPLSEARPLSFRVQEDWLLLKLFQDGDPLEDTEEQEQFCPNIDEVAGRLIEYGFVDKEGALTPKGRERVKPNPFVKPKLKPDPTLPHLVIGPVALGEVETSEPVLMARLDPVAGRVMATANLPTLLVQGVASLEGQDENPAFGDYAAQVAARFLLSLLDKILV